MNRQTSIVPSTALALLMAGGVLSAYAGPFETGEGLVRLAQAEAETPPPSEELKKPAPEELAPAPQAPAETEPAQAETAPTPVEQPPVEATPPPAAVAPSADPAPAAEPAPAEALPPTEEKSRDKQLPAQAAPIDQAPAETAPGEQSPAEAVPANQPPSVTTEESSRKKSRERPEKAEPAQANPNPTETAPAEQKPAETAGPDKQKPAETLPVEQRPAEAAPEGQKAADDAPVEGEPAQAAPNDGSQAPVLDSQKQHSSGADHQAVGGKRKPSAATEQTTNAPVAPPVDDRAAQRDVVPIDIKPVTAEEGKRLDAEPVAAKRRQPGQVGGPRKLGDRTIVQFNNQIVVESNERPRMTRGARDVVYEELPRGRTRETIVRPDGTRVVTVRDRYGDVVRRSRISPDNREYVLVYVDEENYGHDGAWQDPGLDLPPMRLDVPEDEYVLDSEHARAPDAYYAFLDQPPVERVERLYSIEDVKRSARIRDKTRRVDLDTITFEFGSASIADGEVQRLEGVAAAMEKILAKNPGETFLIEGHTDAVGSDFANLALSDRRAEAVAEALTTVFAIPPENLATQGYGEQYLKVRTQAPERENRRVAVRRITALVAPVASMK